MRKLKILSITLSFIFLFSSDIKTVHSHFVELKVISPSIFTKFEDVFRRVDEVQLSTSPDYLVGRITDIVVTNQGNFIISDVIANSVWVFDKQGKFVKQIGKRGSGPGEYKGPHSLALDKDENLYVEDRRNRRINSYDRYGEYKSSFWMKKSPVLSLKIDSKGNIYTYCPSGIGKEEKVIYKYNQNGELIQSFGALPEFMWSLKFAISGGGMVIDEKDFLYQVHPTEYKVSKYSSEGHLVQSFARDASFYKPPTHDMNAIHSQAWMASWTPVSGLYFLEKETILVLINIGGEKNKSKSVFEIFNTDGQFIKGGIELPEDIHFVGSHKDGLYFYEQPNPDKEGNLPNPKIIKYSLK